MLLAGQSISFKGTHSWRHCSTFCRLADWRVSLDANRRSVSLLDPSRSSKVIQAWPNTCQHLSTSWSPTQGSLLARAALVGNRRVAVFNEDWAGNLEIWTNVPTNLTFGIGTSDPSFTTELFPQSLHCLYTQTIPKNCFVSKGHVGPVARLCLSMPEFLTFCYLLGAFHTVSISASSEELYNSNYLDRIDSVNSYSRGHRAWVHSREPEAISCLIFPHPTKGFGVFPGALHCKEYVPLILTPGSIGAIWHCCVPHINKSGCLSWAKVMSIQAESKGESCQNSKSTNYCVARPLVTHLRTAKRTVVPRQCCGLYSMLMGLFAVCMNLNEKWYYDYLKFDIWNTVWICLELERVCGRTLLPSTSQTETTPFTRHAPTINELFSLNSHITIFARFAVRMGLSYNTLGFSRLNSSPILHLIFWWTFWEFSSQCVLPSPTVQARKALLNKGTRWRDRQSSHAEEPSESGGWVWQVFHPHLSRG